MAQSLSKYAVLSTEQERKSYQHKRLTAALRLLEPHFCTQAHAAFTSSFALLKLQGFQKVDLYQIYFLAV